MIAHNASTQLFTIRHSQSVVHIVYLEGEQNKQKQEGQRCSETSMEDMRRTETIRPTIRIRVYCYNISLYPPSLTKRTAPIHSFPPSSILS